MKNKKGFTLIELIGVVTLLALIALVVYPAINTVIKNSKEKAYKDQVEVVVKAAKEWGIDHAEELPDPGKNLTISISMLLQGGYITNDEVKDPRDTNNNLTGSVIVRYEANQYIYEYTSETFKTAIASWLRDNRGTQLTNDAYRGSNPDNYIRFNGEVWRIVKINSDDTVRIVRNTVLPDKRAWDINGSGYWKESSLNEYLNKSYYSTLKETLLVSTGTWCTGTIGNNICETSDQANVGLISANEYIAASANSSCNATTGANCNTSNYLSISGVNYYTLTRGGDIGYDYVYMVNNGVLTNTYTSLPNMTKSELAIRPVINLKATVKIVGGTGSSADPFTISG